MVRRALVLAFALSAFGARSARAWARHGALTALALRGLPALDAPVLPETLDAYLSAIGRAGGVAAFAREQKINPATAFPYQAGEKDGAPLPLRAVIAAYADEPDGGMDQDLFDAYPELWKDDYLYMVGSRRGPQTRAVRHCYWPDGFFKSPPAGSTDPQHDPAPLGEAPERAQRFFDLSREAFSRGHAYWGGRFLAWSLHYVEDLSQPFHSTQIPSMELLRWDEDGKLEVETTARTIIYYHLAVDGFPVDAGEDSDGTAVRGRVEADLSGGDAAPASTARALAEETAKLSAKAAQGLASAAIALFPPPDAGALADPASAVYNARFWSGAVRAPGETARPFMTQLDALLKAMGRAARALALAATAPAARPAAMRLSPAAGARALTDARAMTRALR